MYLHLGLCILPGMHTLRSGSFRFQRWSSEGTGCRNECPPSFCMCQLRRRCTRLLRALCTPCCTRRLRQTCWPRASRHVLDSACRPTCLSALRKSQRHTSNTLQCQSHSCRYPLRMLCTPFHRHQKTRQRRSSLSLRRCRSLSWSPGGTACKQQILKCF